MFRHVIAGLAALALALHAHAREWNVVDAGAKGDGVTDNTTAFQQLLDEAGRAGGGIVKVPTGRYRINGTLRVPGSVTLEGTFRTPPSSSHDNTPDFQGSVLLAYAGRGSQEGEPFIRLAGSMAAVSGLIVHYPEWRQEDVPPVPYPPCVQANSCDNVAVLDCCFINPYEAIHFQLAGRFLVRGVYGYPSMRGLYVDACYDIGRVENCHFWPFGVSYKHDDPYCKWVNTNGVAFEFARTDWQYVLNTFCFGYGVGYKFSETEAGPCNGNFLGIGADSCRRAVLVEQAQRPGLLITNGEFVGRWGSEDSVCVEIAEQNKGKVSLTNCSFWGPNDRCVWLRSPDAQFTANACHFLDWDNTGQGSPAIQLDAGKAIIQGNTFGEGEVHIVVGKDVQSAIVMGNQAAAGLVTRNDAGARTQLLANEELAFAWSDEAKAHYRIDVGVAGDRPHLRRVYDAEGDAKAPQDATFRWTTASTALALPVLPQTPYTVTLKVSVPEAARAEDAGVYFGEQRLAPLPDGDTSVVEVPPCDGPMTVLDLRCKGWRPVDLNPNNNDGRTLGVMLFSVEAQAQGSGARIFEANTGEWRE